MDEKDSFADALRKAREIAARMQVNLKSTTSNSKKEDESEVSDNKKQLALQIATNLSRSRIPKEIRVISQGMTHDGELVIHMMIPSIIVCLFAGKNNETISWMEERSGARIELNSEHPYASVNEKPLSIIGEPDKVEHAREMVNQYIREKDELLGINANNMQLSLGIEYSELLIPKEAVGLVIGKQGENIKKVNNETGCVVKFKPPLPTDDDRYRSCTFQGTATQIKKAREQISELVEYLKQKFGLARPIPTHGQIFEEVRVSSMKAGIVIGRGGENIKQINSLSGATVCIDRSVPDQAEYRTFFVVGTHDQVEHAKFLIREKSGEIAELPEDVVKALNPMTNMELFANQPPCPAFLPSVQQYFYQQPIYDPNHQGYYQSSQDQMQFQYNGNNNSQQPSDPNAQNDYSAAWAAYYQQYYANVGNPNGNPNEPNAQPFDAQAYQAYMQSYYQQYYSQCPEYAAGSVNAQNSTSQPDNNSYQNNTQPKINESNVSNDSANQVITTKVYDYQNKAPIDNDDNISQKTEDTNPIQDNTEMSQVDSINQENECIRDEKEVIKNEKKIIGKKRRRKTKK